MARNQTLLSVYDWAALYCQGKKGVDMTDETLEIIFRHIINAHSVRFLLYRIKDILGEMGIKVKIEVIEND